MSRYLVDGWTETEQLELQSTRIGFGNGLVDEARVNQYIVALSADLMDSVGFGSFKKEFGIRCIEVGVAEQNLVTVASGMAATGQIPFAASYAAFSPGRNWEQIRTTICINNQPVKLVGSHVGLNVGPDGATHQMLEDIALMRVLPNMVVIAPGDGREAAKAARAMAADPRPNYVRLVRESTPVFSLEAAPFEIGRAYVLREGRDVCLLGTGTMTYQLLLAAHMLAQHGIEAEVVHVPTIKPLDAETILASATKCGRVVTAEEAQIAGGFGGAVAELLSERSPMPIERIGVEDRFGESGTAAELLEKAGLDAKGLHQTIREFTER